MQKEMISSQQGVTWRTVLAAIILIPINCYWVIEMEVIRYSGHPVTISLFFNVVFTLFVLLSFNQLLKLISPKLPLSQSELLVLYTMLSIASGITGHDMLEILVPMLGHPFKYASPENEWTELFFPYLPRWLMLTDENAIRGYYEDDVSLYTWEQIRGWLSPVLWWTGFVVTLVFVMLCINVIIRKRWTEQEKLSYPIIQLPLYMTQRDNRSFFNNKMLWIGFGLAAGLDILNGLNFLYPAVPALRTRVQYFRINEKPWNALGSLPVSFYPFAVGLGFFIPLDLSFSCWFFYWFWKFLRMFGTMYRIRGLPSFPYANEQASGGYVALAVIALWASRNHIGQVFRKAMGMRSSEDDSDEPMSYRMAVFGGLIGFALLVAFSVHGGAKAWAAILFFLFYYAITLSVTRMRAELGSPVHDLHYSGPDEILVRSVGTRRLGRGTLSIFSLFWFITRAYRSNPMPHQLEGFKAAERTGMNMKRFGAAMIFAAFLGSIFGFWSLIDRAYRIGGMELKAPWPSITAFGTEPWRRLDGWLNNPSYTNIPATVFMLIGFLITFLLMILRMRFLWFPLHPAGYAISTSWGMNVTWCCLFVSWLLKWIILKYGGLRVHRQVSPLFLGLILGEFTVGSLWTIIGIIGRMPTYGFWV